MLDTLSFVVWINLFTFNDVDRRLSNIRPNLAFVTFLNPERFVNPKVNIELYYRQLLFLVFQSTLEILLGWW